MVLAMVGWAASCSCRRPIRESGAARSRNPVTPTLEILRITRANRAVFLSVLAISWFWFFGVAMLALLPTYTRDVVGGGSSVITFFLALFCVGTGAGSLVCEGCRAGGWSSGSCRWARSG